MPRKKGAAGGSATPDSTGAFGFVFIVPFAIFLAAALVGYIALNRAPITEVDQSCIPLSNFRNVPSPHFAFDAERVIRDQNPLVMRNLTSSWPAIRRWNLNYLLDNLGPSYLLDPVYTIETNYTIWLHREYLKGVSTWPGIKATYRTSSMPLSEFFDEISKPSNSFSYFSGDLTSLSPSLMNDVTSHEQFTLDKKFVSPVWIGSVGVTTQMHYDLSENFHVSVTGRKQFILLSPDALPRLPLFPRIHPSFRRVNVNFECMSDEDRVMITSLNPYSVILEPGDVLYIPPFWLHHVKNLGTEEGSPGISLNFWTKSDDSEKMDEVNKFHLSVPPNLPIELRVPIVLFFLEELCHHVGLPLSSLHGVWQQRFSRLSRDVSKEMGFITKQIVRDCREFRQSSKSFRSKLKVDFQTQLRAVAHKAGAALMKIESASIATNSLFDFIEMTVYRGLGENHIATNEFFLKCFG